MADLSSSDLEAGAILAERKTLSRARRLDAARLDRFLAPDFHEFGAYGVEVTKEGTAERVAAYTAESDDVFVPSELWARPSVPAW